MTARAGAIIGSTHMAEATLQQKVPDHDLERIQWGGEENVPGLGVRFLGDGTGHEDRSQQADQKNLPETDDREGLGPTLGHCTKRSTVTDQCDQKDRHQDDQIGRSNRQMTRPPGACGPQARTDGIGGAESKQPFENGRQRITPHEL